MINFFISEIASISASISPLPFEQIVAVCTDFKCLSYVDENGVWRDAHDDSELRNVNEWFSLEH